MAYMTDACILYIYLFLLGDGFAVLCCGLEDKGNWIGKMIVRLGERTYVLRKRFER